MIKRGTFSDDRLDYLCCYCNTNPPDTRDHVPSRILLDKPFPEIQPFVGCCYKCNNNFSLDEEYFACVLECAIYGTTDLQKLGRERIKKILIRNDSLKRRIQDSFFEENGNKYLKVEQERFENVIVKLAKGHAKFENSEPMLYEPSSIWLKPIAMMTADEQKDFFTLPAYEKAPEVGSRALQMVHLDTANQPNYQWLTVQEDMYQYCTMISYGIVVVRIIIQSYFAIEVTWEH